MLVQDKIRQISKTIEKGKALDIGCGTSPNESIIPHTEYLRLDKNKRFHPDMVSEAHDLCVKDESLNTVVMTEILEHCHDPQRVVDETHRILNDGGVCLCSVPFIYPLHGKPNDYFRFTEYGLNHLFRKFKTVEIHRLGNRLHCIWEFVYFRYFHLILRYFLPLIKRIHFNDETYPLHYVLLARK